MIKVRTNNQPRPIVSGCELDGKQRKQAERDFDFLDDVDSASFVVYRGHVHYLGNFMRFGSHMMPTAPAGLESWTGLESDGLHTGTVIRISDDGETAVMGSIRTTTEHGS